MPSRTVRGGASLTEARVFRCATDPVGHGVVGYHDGVDSWTLDLASGMGGSFQSFVSLHERSHQALHETTAWGTAMTILGLVPVADQPDRASRFWEWMGRGCRETHEQFATLAAVESSTEGLNHLAGNYAYLQYYRSAVGLLAPLTHDVPWVAAADLMYRLVMSPAWLLELDLSALLDCDHYTSPGTTPDEALTDLRHALSDETTVTGLLSAMAGQPTYGERWDAAALALRPHGIRLHDWAAYEAWVPAIILEYNKRRGRAVVLVDSTTGDPTLSRIEAMQRERLTLHAGPLALTWAKAQNPGPSLSPAQIARTHEELGPHVVLAWLHPEVLRKQSVGVPDAWAAPRLGLLACDRRIDPSLLLWVDFDDAPPSVVAASIRKTPFAPLLMTTLYTLQASDGSIDFRGWAPVFVSVDTPIVEFLESALSREEVLSYWVLGTGGSRYLNHVVVQFNDDSALNFVYTCSVMTSRAVDDWLTGKEGVTRRSAEEFTHRAGLAAFIEHLVGSFWLLELGRWPAAPPEQDGPLPTG